MCQKITGNKTKILPMSKTSIFDIPYFCTSNKVSKKLYNWSPKRNLDDIAEDILKWQKKEFKNLKKYFK